MALHSLRDIKRRIRSVENTQQITKAMEMVSAAKLRRAQNVVLSGRPYDDLLKAAMRELASSMESVPHPYFEERDAKSVAVVVVTSDKGLCGAFNSNVIRHAEGFLKDHEGCKLILLGKKANDYFARRRPHDIIFKHTSLGGKVDRAVARGVSRELSDRFLSGEIDQIYLMYTKFITAMKRRIVTERFLPIEKEPASGAGPTGAGATGQGSAGEGAVGASKERSLPGGVKMEALTGAGGDLPVGAKGEMDSARTRPAGEFILEPDAEEMLAQLMPSYAVSRIYMMLAESFASEHGARMIAMGSATKNADEMIDWLILTRNRVRQATITKELAEIVGCTEALRHT